MDAFPLAPNSHTHSLIYDVLVSPFEIMHLQIVFLDKFFCVWSDLNTVSTLWLFLKALTAYPIPVSEAEARRRLAGGRMGWREETEGRRIYVGNYSKRELRCNGAVINTRS